MGAAFGFVQFVLGFAHQHFDPVVDVSLNHLFQVQYVRLTVYQRQHVDAVGNLQLTVFVKIIQNKLRVEVFFYFDHDAHAFAVGFVAQVGNALHPFIPDQFHNFVDQIEFVHHVRDFPYDDGGFAVFFLLHFHLGAHQNFTAPGQVSLTNAIHAVNHAAGGEVRPFDVLHQIQRGKLRIVDQSFDGGHHFAQIMGRDIGGHTDRDAGSAVYQQVGDARR